MDLPPRPEIQQTISSTSLSQSKNIPGPPNFIQVHGGNAPRPEFLYLSSSENTPQPSSCIQIHGGNVPGPSNSINIYGGNAPGPSSSNQAPSAGASRALSRMGARAPTTATVLRSADEVMQNNLELCTSSNIKLLTKKLAHEALFDNASIHCYRHALDEHKLETL